MTTLFRSRTVSGFLLGGVCLLLGSGILTSQYIRQQEVEPRIFYTGDNPPLAVRAHHSYLPPQSSMQAIESIWNTNLTHPASRRGGGSGLCPADRRFLVYVYQSQSPGLEDLDMIDSLIEHLQFGDSWTNDSESACLFVFVAGPWKDSVSPADLQHMIHSLAHWERFSSRHVLVEVSQSSRSSTALSEVDTGSAILATSYLLSISGRRRYLLASPILTRLPSIYYPLPKVIPPSQWEEPSVSLYFEGEIKASLEFNEIRAGIIDLCKQAQEDAYGLECSVQCSNGREEGALELEWSLCSDVTQRYRNCYGAMFALVPIASPDEEVGPATFVRLLESLQCGAVPVIIGRGQLPMDEVIDWTKAAVIFPYTMLPFLKYKLKVISQEDFERYRVQGIFLYKTYFSSQLRIVESVVALIRQQLHRPPMVYPDYTPLALTTTLPKVNVSFKAVVYGTDDILLWNSPPGPFYTHIRPALKSYSGTGMDRHSTSTDHLALERFTIVLLTYHRHERLLQMVESFKGCPMLAKVVVVWNNEEPYKPGIISWPDIGVPIEVANMKNNSLNNRFLPLSNVNTEAILSLDDDICLTHEDIVLGLSVWLKNRDSLVGWMKRYHRLNYLNSGGWNYTYISQHICSYYSMIITNAAFFHKYYTYLYTYWSPVSVRDYVHNQLNCEDIAMNYLVSHITRKPPVLIGGTHSPECPGKEGLHVVRGHLKTRGFCLKKFEAAYGYMPLIKTIYQAYPSLSGPPCIRVFSKKTFGA